MARQPYFERVEQHLAPYFVGTRCTTARAARAARLVRYVARASRKAPVPCCPPGCPCRGGA